MRKIKYTILRKTLINELIWLIANISDKVMNKTKQKKAVWTWKMFRNPAHEIAKTLLWFLSFLTP